jgi:hypothetical protein
MSGKMVPLDEYKTCHKTHYHVAKIERGGKELARARNRIGSRSRGSGWSDQTMHAERAVVKALGDISQLRGSVLIVVRINKHNQIMCSEPCPDCKKFLEKCMKKHGLRKVVYSS